MSFLSVLKKIGQKIVGGQEKVTEYGAIAQTIAALTPGTADDKAVAAALTIANDGLVRFQNIIIDAEVFGQAIGTPGPDKAKMAAPAILQLFLDLPVIKDKKPKDADVTKADAEALGGALAKFLNGFEG